MTDVLLILAILTGLGTIAAAAAVLRSAQFHRRAERERLRAWWEEQHVDHPRCRCVLPDDPIEPNPTPSTPGRTEP